MKQNLDSLKTEILEELRAQGFVVFNGYSRLTDSVATVYWDTSRHPDFRDYLATAKAAGVKLVTFHHREFSSDPVEDALERLEDYELPPEDKRSLDRRLRDFLPYQGFTCALELSFDHQGRVYMFDLHTDWYGEFLDTVDEIDGSAPEEGEEDDEGPIGGYYSRN
jgi:hypothetical protein